LTSLIHGSTPGRRCSEVSSEAADEECTAPPSVGATGATEEEEARADPMEVEEGGVAIPLDEFPSLPSTGRDGADVDGLGLGLG